MEITTTTKVKESIMKKITCSSYGCGSEMTVSRDVESVICSTCLVNGAVKIERQNEKAVNDLKTSMPTCTTPVHKRKRWTDQEDSVIYDKAQTCNIKELMDLLPGRTASAVENRIWNLKMEHVAKQKYIDQIV